MAAAARETKHTDDDGHHSMDTRSDTIILPSSSSSNGHSNGSTSNGHSSSMVTIGKVPDGWPAVLNTHGYPHSLKISKDLLTVKYISKGNHAYDVGSVRTSRPAPRECPIYYYEITVHDPGVRGAITVGLAPEDFNLTRQTGTTPSSYGYRAEDGRKFDGTSRAGQTYGPLFALGDIVGCGLNLYDNTIFFTKNGRNLGIAYTVTPQIMYPTISLHSPNEQISDEKEKMELNVACNRVEPSSLIRMVRQYLLHSGYQDTLVALDSSYGKENAASTTATTPASSPSLSLTSSACSTGDDSDSKRSSSSSSSPAVDERLVSSLPQRKEIRAAIVNGDIVAAMKAIEALTPSLLKTRSSLQFQLHCQQFIGLVKSNELDSAIMFARQVLQTYDEPPNRTVLQGVMGLLAYVNMESSPVAHLLTRAHRESVADQVNTAIVEQLGTQNRSSLEIMLRQLVVTHDMSRQLYNGMTVPLTL